LHFLNITLGVSILLQETCQYSLSSVSSDVNEPGDHTVDYHHQDYVVPPSKVLHSQVREDLAQEVSEGGQEDSGCEPVVFNGVVEAHEELAVAT
jgi:hypothetical protein